MRLVTAGPRLGLGINRVCNVRTVHSQPRSGGVFWLSVERQSRQQHCKTGFAHTLLQTSGILYAGKAVKDRLLETQHVLYANITDSIRNIYLPMRTLLLSPCGQHRCAQFGRNILLSEIHYQSKQVLKQGISSRY